MDLGCSSNLIDDIDSHHMDHYQAQMMMEQDTSSFIGQTASQALQGRLTAPSDKFYIR
jgi:hypothetical protein